jgi:EF-P beta-lysylation protein EpmB
VQPLTVSCSTSWQEIVAHSVTDYGELVSRLALAGERGAEAAAGELPVRVPPGLIERIKAGDRHDPILRQVLPLACETEEVPGFTTDPLGEAGSPVSGLLQRFHGRALLLVTGACPVHCRYCFRRHFSFAGYTDLAPALAAIAADPSISEVILSGGDPLMVADQQLAELVRELAAIPHLQRLRVHTRMPVVIPERVTDSLTAWLTSTRLEPLLVLHSNHAGEITDSVRTALGRLREAGIILLNQSVLLRGVNDQAEEILGLSRRLVSAGVLPYYLHMLDRVRGAAHFEVTEAAASRILGQLLTMAPGYMVPRLVREHPHAKLPIRASS